MGYNGRMPGQRNEWQRAVESLMDAAGLVWLWIRAQQYYCARNYTCQTGGLLLRV